MSDKFIWEPNDELVEQSNVNAFMKKIGVDNVTDLYKKSVENIEWFWSEVEKELGIHWFEPYSDVLDVSKGIPWATWFVGGKTNIAYNCLDRHALGEKKNKIAVIWEGEDGSIRKASYEDIYQQSVSIALFLKEQGVGKGDAVGVFMPMVPEIVSVIMAIARIGAVFVPIFSGYGSGAVATRLQDSGAKVMFTADGFLRRGKVVNMKEVADEAADQSPSIKKIVVFPRLGIDVPWNDGRDVRWDDVLSYKGDCPAEALDSEHMFMIIYTSGTTGRPKGAVHVHAGFNVKIAQEVYHNFDLKDNDILFWFTDMGWIMGPWEVVGAMTVGGTIFTYEGVPDYPHPGRLWEVIERHKITILGFSPTGVRAMMKYGTDHVKKYDLSSLRLLGSTGEPWNPEPYKWFFYNIGGGRCPIINISGGTEVGACFLAPLPIIPMKICSLGMPALGMDIDVFNEEGKPVRGEVGELVCKQPWPGMTRGLYKAPERYIETYWSRWENVWVHGDWASVDEDGYWFLHGRSDDTIKVAGKRIGPAEVESALVNHPAVQESAAIGVPDEVKGERIVCFVILKPGYDPDDSLKNELKNTAAEILGKTMVPSEIYWVKDLPRTRNAKILRRVIRKVFLGEDAGDLSSLENPAALQEIKKIKKGS